MDYQKLGKTDLEVSRLCLGTMTMGWTSGKEESFAVMDYALEQGVNFFDTADIYSFWATDNEGGVAETWIGEWLKARASRDQLIIATKVRGRMWPGPDGEGLSRSHLMRAVEDSLRRLQVETIDLYQTHWPDEEIALEETFRAFDDMVRQGKVRYLGCSNHSPDQLQEALDVSAEFDLPPYHALQPHYNMVHRRDYEGPLKDIRLNENLGVIPYSPLAGGFLTGKYRQGSEVPVKSRGYGNDRMKPYLNKKGFAIIDALVEISQAHEATPAQTAIAWLLADPTITSPIIGANTVSQLSETIQAVDLELSAEEKARLDALPSPT